MVRLRQSRDRRPAAAPGRGRGAAWALALALLLGLAGGAGAEEEAAVEAAVKDARALLALEEEGVAARALERLDAARPEARESFEFWELYLRAWLAAGRSPESFFEHGLKPEDGAGADATIGALLKARRAADAAARRAILEAAARRAPRGLPLRLRLIRELIGAEAYVDAEDLLDAVLEAHPGLEEAVTLKGELLLEDGMASRVVDLAEQGLERGVTAGLLALKSRALKVMARHAGTPPEQERLRTSARQAAEEAVERDPRPAHVLLLADLLDEAGEADAARTLVERHFKERGAPELGLRLAHDALAAGDYAAAVRGLAPAALDHRAAARALAVAHARLGQAEAARRAVAQVLTHDPDAVALAAEVELALGDWQAALARLGERDDPAARAVRVRALAFGAQPEPLAALAGDAAREGRREGEEVVLALLEARALRALGPKADGLRRTLVEGRAAAGRMRPARPESGSPGFKPQARTEGFALRVPTYVRAVSGCFFRPRATRLFFRMHLEVVGEGQFSFSRRHVLACGSDCEVEPERDFAFEGLEVAGAPAPDADEEEAEEEPRYADFAPAAAAFARGCQAVIDGDLAAAAAAMDEVLAIEPHFGRAALIRAAARLLPGTGDPLPQAVEVRDRLRAWPDDFDARRLGVILRTLAGDGTVAAEIAALCEREAQYCERRIAHL